MKKSLILAALVGASTLMAADSASPASTPKPHPAKVATTPVTRVEFEAALKRIAALEAKSAPKPVRTHSRTNAPAAKSTPK